MNNDTTTLQKIDGIYDIQPLIEPAYSSLEITVLSILILLFTITSLYIALKYFFSKKAISKRRIIKLQKQYLKNAISIHDAVYALCHHLNAGLNVKHIDTNTSLPNKISIHYKEWQLFTRKISDLRYKNINSSSIDINELFKESFMWLKKWP